MASFLVFFLYAEGFTSIILLLMTNSRIMLSLRIIGYYLARIYEEMKNCPPAFDL